MTNARVPPLLRPRPLVNLYPPILTLALRQLRTLVAAESSEALRLSRSTGVPTP